ncbi:TetR/AcrR family transcriptional regulator [Ferroacidibacillus organovorans]|uniref:TetR family transcriptional regulator n=1 Tax=Ferroacidibacillus organovorans TaxID=1765683 RepID=A0A162TJP8_9BACL|nr:TetR/AcrR family transcriptional regulator [Ferroacidibacillus organovorans]KYP80873.1 TetR family transcriptional regulator [Ferroacidibacillus organovorans]OAG95418.1 TetR family transcriptional regulator [Ferroacidibacillus organovorans]OPG15745.1 TetR family transcriptional regulator [Ferroacidibacillus organovorans]
MSIHKIATPVKDLELVRVRREQIVNAATTLFLKKGYHRTTTREIARESGLGTGTLYEYIGSKEDILLLVCDMIHSQVEVKLHATTPNGMTMAEAFPGLLKNFFHAIDDVQDLVVLIYQETRSLPKDYMRAVLAREQGISDYFAKLLQRGIEDGSFTLARELVMLMAHNITVLGQMWAFRRWSIHRSYTLDTFTETQTSLIMRELCSAT